MLVKKFLKGVKVIALGLAVMMASLNAFTASANNTEPAYNPVSYVVIGAFMYKNNAIRFTDYARRRSLDAKYMMNPLRNLYYVYVFSSPSKEEAVEEVYKVRVMPEFRDAWVYTKGQLPPAQEKPVTARIESPDNSYVASPESKYVEKNQDYFDNPAGEEPEEIDIDEEEIEEPEEEVEKSTEYRPEENIIKEPMAPVENDEPQMEEKEAVTTAGKIEKKEGHFYMYFNAVNKKTYEEVKGKIKVLDLERIKEIKEAPTHQLVELRDPNNGTNRIKLTTDIFGFKQVQHELDLDEPVNDTTQSYTSTIGDSIIVDFQLERFKKGDVLIMYNVYFYIDASIMKPESVYELNSLLDMLEENQKLMVRIHGHTNGNSQGKIIHLNKEDQNFFSMNANHLETVGSAKKLSLYRAETIRDWLIAQGIEPSRLEVQGWGGKRMLHDKFDPLAHKNVRVEVEILAD